MADDEHYLKQELYERLRTDPKLFDWIESGSLDGVWYWDLENQQHEWLSPKFKTLFGYDEDEIPHTSEWWQQNIFEDDLPAVIENFDKHCADPTHPYDQVVRYRHKNGHTIWVRCRGKVIFNQQGKPSRMLGAHTDLTALMQAKEELGELTRKLKTWASARQAIFEAILDSVIVIDQFGIIHDCNQASLTMFGYDRAELEGQNVSILMDSKDAKQHDHYLHNHIITGQSNIIGKGRELMARRKNGEMFYIYLSVAKYKDGDQTKFVGTIKDTDEQVKRRLKLEYDALHDVLTGLPTRRLLAQKIEHAISLSLRESKTFYLLFIDLNKFKPINDELGHDIGDEVLRLVSKRMQQTVRPGDLCARLGGDEFVILCQPHHQPWDVEKLKSKLNTCISDVMHIEGHRISVGTSIGIANFPDDAETTSDLLRCADKRMYKEKCDEPTNDSESKELVSVTYISHSLLANDAIEEQCEQIRKVASRNNAAAHISGLLIYCRDRFIQRLEGPRSAIDLLLGKIRHDPRHRNFSVLSYSKVSKRFFADWSQMQVVYDASTVDILDQFLLSLESKDRHTLSDQEARFILDYIQHYTGEH